MTDTFHLPIDINGEEKTFPTRILRYGYTHKIEVIINDIPVIFELDEDGTYRAIIESEKAPSVNREILQQVSLALSYLLSLG